jgi:acetoin utilization deacetylase AcuC-like enzyme
MQDEHMDLKEKVRIIYHPDYLNDYSTASCETPERIRSIMKVLGGMFTVIEPAPCSEDDLLLCHSEGLVHMERNMPGRLAIAQMAAGGAILSARSALDGHVPFAVIRPPGHHANPDHNWGFCFFNNMGIAIRKLQKEGKITTAVVLDIDLHFGDGTDIIFKDDPNVRVLNIQSSNPDDFIRTTDSALNAISQADIIGISAGFDQYEKDWGGNLSTGDYNTIGRIAGNWAKTCSRGRIFTILEGGYYIPDLGKNALSLIQGICEGLE